MLDGLQFAILGLAAGAAYGLTALGLVVIYRGSSVVNFAHGGFAAVAAYLYWWLTDKNHWPWLAGAVVAIFAAALLGALTNLVVMRPMRRSSPLTRTIATLGVLIVVQSILVMTTPALVLSVPSFLPAGGFHVGHVVLGYDRLIISTLTVVICIGLMLISKRTKFGLATSAAAENPRSTAALGYSPDRIATINWAIGSGLAGTAAVLLTPILGLQITTMTALTFPCLAAAVVGRMSSYGITLIAGFGLGIAESLVTNYVHTPGWTLAIPFLVILAMMTLRGRTIPSRGEIRDKLPAVGTGRLRLPVIVVGVLLGLYLVWGPFESVYIDATTTTVGIAIVLLSQVVMTGYAGQLSLCQFSMAGLGALIAGRMMVVWGIRFELAAPVAMIAAFLIGLLLGLPALRTRGVSLAVLTMGFAVALQSLIFGGTLSGVGISGDQVGSRSLFGFDIDGIAHPRRYATFAIAAFLLGTIAVANVRRSQSGRRMIAVRESERAARALGIDVYSVKLYAFSLGAAIAAGGGIVLAYRNPTLTYGTGYDYTQSLSLLADGVVGGLGSVAGALVGAFSLAAGGIMYQVLATLLRGHDQVFVLIGGLGLIYVLWDASDGVVLVTQQRFTRLRNRIQERRHPAAGVPVVQQEKVPTTNEPRSRVTPRTLVVDEATVKYGGVTAVDAVSLSVGPGEVVGVIGPNGAGKTSLIDVITGFTQLSGGAISVDGESIAGIPAHRRTARGLGRSFQSLELFEDFTVYENLLAACDRWSFGRFFSDMVVPSRGTLSPGALEAVQQFGLTGELDRKVRELPYGRRRLCAVARAVAAEPSILLLDEPAAGLGDEESAELAKHIRSLADDRGMGVLLIEHNLDMVVKVSDRLVALDFGKTIATGAPEGVRRDPSVVVAYLGLEPEPLSEYASSASEESP
jgi:ABC-type branched-subunit amino acid transport system ATPase component/branched-subunit amino acid ABC-type transport system permease component